MRNIIGQTKSGFDFQDIMNNNKILLVNLSKGKLGDLNSKLLGIVFVMKFQAAAMARAKIPEDERKAAFDKTMTEIQSEMSPASRTFSKVIHNPAVEKSSEVIGNTVARPNAILSGSAAAFILTAGIYLVAKHFGYSLSGTETIATFVLGWVIGLIYDYIRVLIFGKSK
jgi:hypothetical protein